MTKRRKLAAGNWKMNGLGADLDQIARLDAAHPAPGCEVLICPPATLLERMSAAARGTAIMTGAQDCHPAASGAHTGDLSVAMIADAGASHVIVGHSERRADHGETSADVRAKAEAVMAGGLVALICIGETLDEREAGRTLEVIGTQLRDSTPDGAGADTLVVAYEPVWAIGTGRIPTLEQIAEVHGFIRAELGARFGGETGAGVRILYGGSVKPGNAAEIFGVDNVDGALVGGASLKAEDFAPIIAALQES